MFVASRRIHPPNNSGQPFPNPTDPSTSPWVAKEWKCIGPAVNNVPGFPAEPSPGSYRKYRLKSSYDKAGPLQDHDSTVTFAFSTSSSGLTAMPGLNPSALQVQTGGTPSTISTTGTTPWFTWGDGTSVDISAHLGEAAYLVAQFSSANAQPPRILEVVLECWDFTTPYALEVAIPESTLVGILTSPQRRGHLCSDESHMPRFGLDLYLWAGRQRRRKNFPFSCSLQHLQWSSVGSTKSLQPPIRTASLPRLPAFQG